MRLCFGGWNVANWTEQAAPLFIEQGWTLKKVQTVIGHASIQMTFDLYGKLFTDEKSDHRAITRPSKPMVAVSNPAGVAIKINDLEPFPPCVCHILLRLTPMCFQ